MEMPGSCAACGEERMVLDEIHGVLACDACGTVGNQTETELHSEFQTGHVIERHGTYVGGTDSGVAAAKGLMRGQIASHSFFTGYPGSSEIYRMETMKKVESITALLRVPTDKVNQAKQLLESTLKRDWGMGRWVDILVVACVYIVIRQSQLPLTVPEVADCVNCDVVELGRMYNRVLVQLGISLVCLWAILWALVHMYSKSGNIDDVRFSFDRMEKQFPWTVMINELAKDGPGSKACEQLMDR